MIKLFFQCLMWLCFYNMGLCLIKPQKLVQDMRIVPLLINSILALFLIDVRLEFFSIQPLRPTLLALVRGYYDRWVTHF